jgi:hypothetical protein
VKGSKTGADRDKTLMSEIRVRCDPKRAAGISKFDVDFSVEWQKLVLVGMTHEH